MNNIIRKVRFQPYASGAGPTFNLEMREAVNTVGYTLSMRENKKRTDIFSGDGFIPSCLHARDSDESVLALVGFLTLRPAAGSLDHVLCSE